MALTPDDTTRPEHETPVYPDSPLVATGPDYVKHRLVRRIEGVVPADPTVVCVWIQRAGDPIELDEYSKTTFAVQRYVEKWEHAGENIVLRG